jgi:hypothetical protein
VVNRDRNQEFVNNFNNEVYQRLIPIDLEHETFLSGAVAYYEPSSAVVEDDGSASIGVRWEERGAQALNEGRFYYFSPMWFDKWKEPLTGKIFNNVLIGGALTTSPYFKDANLRPLYASELTVNQVHVDGPMEKEEKEASSTCTECKATMEGDGSHKCSIPAPEPEKEKVVPEDKKEDEAKAATETTTTGTPAVTVAVDPAQFNQLQSQFAEMQKLMAKQDEELKVANEKLARSATEARQRKFKEVIMGTNGDGDGAVAFRGDISVHGGVLDAIYQFEGEEGIAKEDSLFQRYTAEMRGLAEQLADSELLKSRGGTGGRTPSKGSATVRWNEAVAKVMSEQKISETQAYAIVAKAQPELYRQQSEENYATKGEND